MIDDVTRLRAENERLQRIAGGVDLASRVSDAEMANTIKQLREELRRKSERITDLENAVVEEEKADKMALILLREAAKRGEAAACTAWAKAQNEIDDLKKKTQLNSLSTQEGLFGLDYEQTKRMVRRLLKPYGLRLVVKRGGGDESIVSIVRESV